MCTYMCVCVVCVCHVCNVCCYTHRVCSVCCYTHLHWQVWLCCTRTCVDTCVCVSCVQQTTRADDSDDKVKERLQVEYIRVSDTLVWCCMGILTTYTCASVWEVDDARQWQWGQGEREAPSLFVCCSVLQCLAVCCSVLQCVAVCCSVLQCVAVCCSVLQQWA